MCLAKLMVYVLFERILVQLLFNFNYDEIIW